MTKKRKELLEVRHPSRPQFVDGHPVLSEDELKQLRKDYQPVSTVLFRRRKREKDQGEDEGKAYHHGLPRCCLVILLTINGLAISR